ncbi:MAG: hypothetical protein AAB368_17465, partial [bacterium]
GARAGGAQLAAARGIARVGTVNDAWRLAPWCDVLWACDGGWSPRIPDTGAMPKAPGTYTYDSSLAKNDSLWLPVFTAPAGYRYLQFEVSLYNNGTNDAPAPTLPEFEEFRVEYEAVTVPPVETPAASFLAFPSPLGGANGCRLTLQFTMTPAGGEAHARVYNAAGRQVAKGDWRYGPVAGSGMIVVKETIDACSFAPGAYMAVIDVLGADGRGGLVNVKSPGGAALRKATAKFVVRR